MYLDEKGLRGKTEIESEEKRLLKEAKEKLLNIGWIQGHYKLHKIPGTRNVVSPEIVGEIVGYCTLGALGFTTPFSHDQHMENAAALVHGAISKAGFAVPRPVVPDEATEQEEKKIAIARWNDRDGRKLADVIKVLDTAIEEA